MTTRVSIAYSLPAPCRIMNVMCSGKLTRLRDWLAAIRNPGGDRPGLSALRATSAAEPLLVLISLAEFDNVAMQDFRGLSAVPSEFPYQDIWEPLSKVFDALCMWGTDWTRSEAVAIRASRPGLLLRRTERAALMGGTLRGFTTGRHGCGPGWTVFAARVLTRTRRHPWWAEPTVL